MSFVWNNTHKIFRLYIKYKAQFMFIVTEHIEFKSLQVSIRFQIRSLKVWNSQLNASVIFNFIYFIEKLITITNCSNYKPAFVFVFEFYLKRNNNNVQTALWVIVLSNIKLWHCFENEMRKTELLACNWRRNDAAPIKKETKWRTTVFFWGFLNFELSDLLVVRRKTSKIKSHWKLGTYF